MEPRDLTLSPEANSISPKTPAEAPTAMSLLAAVGGADDDEVVIAIATDLARRHRSSVTVVNTFEPAPSAVMRSGYAGAMVGMRAWRLLEQERVDVAGRVRHLVRQYALSCPDERGGEALQMAPPSSSCWATLMRELPLTDLVILAQSSVEGDGPWVGPLGEALMAARVPVYVARDGRPTAGHPAAIAWDGGFEAARAVRAATPLLRDAGEVAIVQAIGRLEAQDADRADPERLRAWLSGHGVKPGPTLRVVSNKLGEGLLAAARDFGAALFVAGAYHHSRVEEALFGGATRAFLEASDGPHLLVAH